MNDQPYWLGFSLIPGIGPRRLLKLYDEFGSLVDAWHATENQLERVGLGEQALKNLLRLRQTLDLQQEMKRVEQVGAWLLTLADVRYPPLLREMDEPPAVLYVRGTLLPEDHRALAVVGTRKATRYGRDAAYHLARELARQGVTIVSGLAHGVDSAAHKGALDSGGRTIAVLGCGVDVIYPHDNDQLARQIMRHGALISEHALGTQPIAMNFPRRNRIMSGLSLGVLVVEAPEKSGSLITAGLAGEQGREVFAVPANIFNKTGHGTNRLIQDGAKLVMNAEDILEELNIVQQNVQTRTQTTQIIPANDSETRILAHLTTDPTHIDDLVRLSGLPIAEVSSTLTILELKGVAQMVGHMQYCLIYTP